MYPLRGSWGGPLGPGTGSDREGASAAASARSLGIGEAEALSHHAGHIVDLHALEILGAEGVHENPEVVQLQHFVVVFGRLFDVQTVLEAGTTAGKDGDTQPGGGP